MERKKYLVDNDLVSANAKSSRVKGKWSGLWYLGVSGSLAGSDDNVALLGNERPHLLTPLEKWVVLG